MTVYNHREIERRWQKQWEKDKLYVPDVKKAKKPFYNLWMFPYPSAEGLHAGHAFASTGSDIYGRFMRMQGNEVFQPIGYDSFGIHSENFALKIGQTPQEMLARAFKHYEQQFKFMGHGYDWTRTVTTSGVDYYRWTQWLFIQLFKAGLAYKKKAAVNWCPSCKTVLADEQIFTPAAAGKWPKHYARLEDIPEGVRVCERCGSEPQRRELEQWFFRITNYADRLLEGLTHIDWSERVVVAQRQWIGKKEGINISYPIAGTESAVVCFTTRPDTNFGVTFIVVAPEYAKRHLSHLVPKSNQKEVAAYIAAALKKSEQQRLEEGRQKTGVFTGLYAVNQLNDYQMPIWVSDFVLMGVGTGAVIGVPGHDRRDFEFAQAFNLPIKRVVVGKDRDRSEITKLSQVQEEEGTMVNSEFLDGLDIHQATVKMLDFLQEKGWGKRVSSYHLRDWLISRQRYWGPPIPMIYCPACAARGECWFSREKHACPADWNSTGWYPEENLPVRLPVISDYQPQGSGKGPLASHPEFYKTKCPHCGSEAVRETDVSDTFVDSSWYFLRYPSVGSPTAQTQPFDRQVTRKWLPVSLYFGGAEHAVLHLMYARFVTMALYDLKLVTFEEPFPRFYAHGLMIKDGAKMSKSRGNVVNPDDYIAKYGADALRLYLMFMGPMDSSPDFRDAGMEGMARFVSRLWRVCTGPKLATSDEAITRATHATIKRVTTDVEKFKYNTAIAALMEFVNLLQERGTTPAAVTALVLLAAPFAPHLAEELWHFLGHTDSVHLQPWPEFDAKFLWGDKTTMVVQINGKVRQRLEVSMDEARDEPAIKQLALASDRVKAYLKGTDYKTIFVPGRLINIVT